MTIVDFSFEEHAAEFDAHILASIPSYDRLRWWCEKLSRRFVQSGTRVVDVGCSTGSMLKAIRDANQGSRPGVNYLGIDLASCFEPHWLKLRADDLQFEARDALTVDFTHTSLVIASFTLQFIPERKKLALLQPIYDGLVEGGALFIAEKTLASSSALQELIVFAYYDHKRRQFTAEQILEKERRLRGVMTPWARTRLIEALLAVGFRPHDIEAFWQEGPFVGLVAMKRTALVRSRKCIHG